MAAYNGAEYYYLKPGNTVYPSKSLVFDVSSLLEGAVSNTLTAIPQSDGR